MCASAARWAPCAFQPPPVAAATPQRHLCRQRAHQQRAIFVREKRGGKRGEHVFKIHRHRGQLHHQIHELHRAAFPTAFWMWTATASIARPPTDSSSREPRWAHRHRGHQWRRRSQPAEKYLGPDPAVSQQQLRHESGAMRRVAAVAALNLDCPARRAG